jgi:hypothetical protein
VYFGTGGVPPLQLQGLQYRSDWPAAPDSLYTCTFLGKCLCSSLVVFMLDTKVLILWVFLWKEKKMASQCTGNKNKLRTFEYNFNKKWENKHFFTNVNKKCVCLICNASVAVSKKCNVEWHFMTMHKDYISKYPNNSKIHRNKVEDLKRNLQSHQAILTKPKQLPLVCIKSQKYWLRRRKRSPLKMVMWLKNV